MTNQQGTPEAPKVRTADYEAGWKDGYKHGAWSTQQDPTGWYVTGCSRLLDEDEAKAEARHIGGTARAIPLYTAPQPAPPADSVPAIQGETNVQLDIDSNHSAPGQQRDMACSLALGQPVGNGQDQAAGHLGAQGDKLLTVAERNIRSFLRRATFKSESDREAALNCVDVLWEAARAAQAAESVPVPVQSGLAATMLDALRHAQKVLNHNNLHLECGPVNAAIDAARAPADSVLEDAARLDWLDQQCEAYGFQDIHEGNRWEISGPYANVRKAIDAEMAAARKQGGA